MTRIYGRRQLLYLLSSSAMTVAACSFPKRSQQSRGSNSEEGEDQGLHFAVVGDTGRGNRAQYAVARAMARHHQETAFPLVLLTGDNIYEDGEMAKVRKVFEKPYRPLLKQAVQFRAVLGNHDIREGNGNGQVAYPGFNMDGRYYSFRRGLAHFFALDTNENSDWDQQLAWLKSTLANSDAPWKIIYGHHPIYSSGSRHGNSPDLIEKLCPIFQQYAVQLYCCGHDHNYERTHPIQGTTYLISGAGSGTRPVGKSAWTAYSEEILSFASVQVHPDKLLITGLDRQNNVIDQGVIPRAVTGHGPQPINIAALASRG